MSKKNSLEIKAAVSAFVLGHFAIDEKTYINAQGHLYIPPPDYVIPFDKYGLLTALEKARNLVKYMNKLNQYSPETYEHSKEVGRLATYLGMYFDFNLEELYDVGVSGLLHDLGKLNIPLHILEKPDTLNTKEMEIMEKHTEYGANYLKTIFDANHKLVQTVLRHHQDHHDGYILGGLKEEKINEFSQIVSVTDIWSALNNDRSYRKSFPLDKAIQTLKEETQEHHIEEKYITALFDLLKIKI